MPKSPWWLTTIMILSLLLGLSGPTIPSAEAADWQSKVDSSVLAVAEVGEVEFLVLLSEQTDLSAAAALGSKTAKGAYVYQTLSSTAESSQKALRAMLDSKGVPYRSYWVVNTLWVRGDINLIQQIAQRPEVAHVYANPQVQLSLPEQTLTIEPYGATAIVWNIQKINADDVWGAGYTGQGVIIGGADTGYTWDHPALINQYRGWDGATASHDYNWHDATGGSPNTPVDPYGHGTHTMGIMVGDDGGSNQIGVAPGAKWIGCRNMDSSGFGTPERYIECYQWFIAPYPIGGDPFTDGDPTKAPDVINNSWGCPPSEGCTDPNILLEAVQNVNTAGILTVHSAGNGGSSCSTVDEPATIYAESFSVGAVNSSDTIATFSSRGPVTIDGSNRLKPNITAPGVSILSSIPEDAYGYKQGTSMAAPHIAGVIALLISANPALSGQNNTIRTLIEKTAVPLLSLTQTCGDDSPTSHPNNVYGWGRVDAWAAYQELLPDLLVNKTAPETIVPGNVLTYTLVVTNSHPFSITHNVILTDTIPDKTSLLTATGNYSVTGRLITWALGDIDAQAAKQVNFSVRVPFATSGVIINDSYGARSDEVSTTVQGDPVSTLVHEPGVELSAGQTDIIFDPCGTTTALTYTHQITNTGNYTDTFNLAADSSQSWAQIDPVHITLSAADSAFFEVKITPTCPTPAGTIDITVVSATSVANASVFATLTDTTQIGYRVFSPLIAAGE